MRLTQIFRYPVKGFSAQSLASATLIAAHGVRGDRALAIAHGRSVYDIQDPAWQQRRNFLNVAHSPRLASLDVQLDEGSGEIRFCDEEGGSEYVGAFSEGPCGAALTDFLARYATENQPPPFLIASARHIAAEAGFTDSEKQGVSILNMASVAALSDVLHAPVDAARFRANVWVDGAAPWAELGWPGKTIRLGNALLRVMEPITRCAAVDTEPGTGRRDLRVLEMLKPLCGAPVFGVLAEVVTGGEIALGDTFRLLSDA